MARLFFFWLDSKKQKLESANHKNQNEAFNRFFCYHMRRKAPCFSYGECQNVSTQNKEAKRLVDYLSAQFQMAQISTSSTTTEYLVSSLANEFPKALRN